MILFFIPTANNGANSFGCRCGLFLLTSKQRNKQTAAAAAAAMRMQLFIVRDNSHDLSSLLKRMLGN
jgi:hypothetical protein